ncbi:glycosyltransferase family 2 protein [Thermodesulfobacteriota bacterium]
MPSPLVSVVIPVYNYEEYIAAAIESVLAQSFADWELIIVDDHSSDKTPEIVDSYTDGKKIKSVRNEQNQGQFPTHNRGAALARGKYIKFLHGDDIMYPHCLEIMVALMEAFPEAGLGISQDSWPFVAPKLFSPIETWRLYVAGQMSFMSEGPSGTIFQSNAFNAVGGFDPPIVSADSKINLLVAQRFSVLVLPQGLKWYRYHEKQVAVVDRANDLSIKERIIWYPKMLNDPDNPLPASERKEAKKKALQNFIKLCLHHLKHFRIQRAFDIWEASGLPIRTWLRLLEPRPNIAKFDIEPSYPPDWTVYPGKPSEKIFSASNNTSVINNADELKAKNGKQNANDEYLPSTDNFSHLTDKPLVSVLIPAFNAEHYIKEAIQSVLVQRFNDWELIIVNDASKDQTSKICQDYADGNRVRYFRNENNLGKWENHNHSVELARGKYLKFLHSGDLLYPHCLAMMVSLMESYPDAGLGISGNCGPYRAGVCLDPELALRSEFFGTPRFLEGPTALIIRKDVFIQSGGFESKFEPCERHLQLKIANVSPIVLINKGLVHYRNYSQTTYMGQEKWRLGWADGYDWIINWLSNDGIYLDRSECKTAITNLLRYAWRGGDPYLPKKFSIRKLTLQERIQIIKIAIQQKIPIHELIMGPKWKKGWTKEMHQQIENINIIIPEKLLF